VHLRSVCDDAAGLVYDDAAGLVYCCGRLADNLCPALTHPLGVQGYAHVVRTPRRRAPPDHFSSGGVTAGQLTCLLWLQRAFAGMLLSVAIGPS
jgi:hypothetical protein